MTIEQANLEYSALLRGITLERELGRGSAGAVYAATDTDGSSCRIKIIRLGSEEDMADLRADGYDDEDIHARFETAMRGIVAQIDRLRRLNVPTIMATEDRRLVRGRSGELILLIRTEPLTVFDEFVPSHDITANDVLNLGIAVCSALEAANSVGVLHGNLQPSNLFIAPDGTVCVGDFASERQLAAALDSVSFGSLCYLPPEQQADAAVTAETDLYALGIILYSLFNNRCLPYLGRPDADENAVRRAILRRDEDDTLPPPANADEDVVTMLNRACARDPKRRYSSPAAFADDLRDCLLEESEDYVLLPATETIFEILPLRSGEPEKPGAVIIAPDEDDEVEFTRTAPAVATATAAATVASVYGAPAAMPTQPNATGAYAGGAAYAYQAANNDAIRAAQAQQNVPAEAIADPYTLPDLDEGDYDAAEEEGENNKRLLWVAAAILALLLLFGGIVWGISALRGIGDDDDDAAGQPGETTVDRTTTDAPVTKAPETTEAPADTTDAPATTEDPAVTAAPTTTAAPETTKAPETTAAPAQAPKMPTLTGKNYDAATATLTGLGIGYKRVSAYSDTVPAGQIISQSVAAGTAVKQGETVSLTVSLGKEQVTVTSLAGKTQAQAETALAELNLQSKVEKDYSDTVPAGSVIKQTPAPGKIDVGGTVTLTVSQGKREITLASVVGKTRAEAEAYFKANNLTQITWQSGPADIEVGKIYAQSPKADSKVTADSSLIIYISTGRQLKVPTLRGMDEASADAILRGLGYAPVFVYQTANTDGVLSTSPAAGTSLTAGSKVTVTVATRDADAAKLSLPQAQLNLAIAQTVTLRVDGAQGRKLTFESANSKVATVDGGGKITAKAVGSTTVTVSAGNERVVCTVVVTETSADFTSAVTGTTCTITAYRGSSSVVTVPDRINGLPVSAIAPNAFKGTAVTAVIIPDTVTSIGVSAFENCAHLASVSLPSSLRTIGDRAFASCVVMTRIDIPAGVISIGASAFERCYALETVYLPASLTSIGDRAFAYCTELVIYAPEGSPAVEYAKGKGLAYKVMG